VVRTVMMPFFESSLQNKFSTPYVDRSSRGKHDGIKRTEGTCLGNGPGRRASKRGARDGS